MSQTSRLETVPATKEASAGLSHKFKNRSQPLTTLFEAAVDSCTNDADGSPPRTILMSLGLLNAATRRWKLGDVRLVPRSSRRRAIAFAIVIGAATVGGCAEPRPIEPAAASPGAGSPSVGVVRSLCTGAVSSVNREVNGIAADQLEELQATFGREPGFLAVVNAAGQSVIVVEAGALPEWQNGLAGTGTRVAPSCIDPRLLRAVQGAVGRIQPAPGRFVGAGYDAFEDAINVEGTTPEALLAALEAAEPGSSSVAQAAMSAGTLRVRP